ncbi:putative lysosomal acid phosphatase [Podospora conica]|nr:putative lysosomal acid phosphatase [Schizothecium conicum]
MLTATTLLGLLAGTAVAETVHGVVVFTRHGDRTTKHYGAQSLTSLGATQNFQVGADYRARYLAAGSPHQIAGISESKYISSQIYATAPNSGILLNTATAFLQGLYPPLVDLAPEIASQTLTNGTKSTSPLNGYQYVTLQGVKANSPDTIWIKGDESCPALDASISALKSTPAFTSLVASTRPFYQSLYPALQSVSDIPSPASLSFASAYDIFDLLNVARIHNTSTTPVSDADLFQLRTLADAAEFAHSYSATDPALSTGARTFAGAVLAQLNKTVASAGALKFSLLAGSYDTFLGFAGLAGLTAASADFYGLPGYASTMAFEVFSAGGSLPAADDLRVRFLFRNGTEGALTAFPLFGGSEESLGWAEFVREMQARAITTVEGWCGACRSEVDFCKVYEVDGEIGAKREGGMSSAVAGVVGALVTLGVVALVGGFVVLVMMRRRGRGGERGETPGVRSGEKGSVRSFASEVTV